MRHSVWNARIPNLLALIVLIVGIAAISFLSARGVIFRGRADAGSQPKNVRISNLSDTSATISYTTDDPVIGAVHFGTDENFGQIGVDDRDKQASESIPHTVHYITLSNLTPETTYSFIILSNDTEYRNDETPFTLTTGKQLPDSQQAVSPLQGKIVRTDGNAPLESVVYVTGDTMQTISALAMPDGRYSLPLQSVRSEDLAELTLQPQDTLKLLAVTNSETASATLFVAQDGDVPTITLTKSYNFTLGEEQVEVSSESAVIDFPSFVGEELQSQEETISITTPEQDAQLTDVQPLFRGTAFPNESVELTIESASLSTTVQADANGQWQFRPDESLAPGAHTLAIQTKNESGILTTLSQSFTVFAEGSQFTDPSVTPTQSPEDSPTPAQEPTPTDTPTPTVTPTISEVLIPTPTPSDTPTPTIQQGATTTVTQPPIPKAGGESLVIAGIVSVSLSVLGFLMFILTRGGTPLR